MPALSSLFLVAALVLSVVVGPQIRPWIWGPALAALGLAVVAAVPVLWKRGRAPADWGVIALGVLAAAWFAWRAWLSPVAEFGLADQLLLGGAVGAFVSVRAIAGNPLAERILIWGVALLLVANLVVIGQQMVDPACSPVLRSRGVTLPSGFFAAYNEAANYLIASAMLVGAAALFGRHARATRLLWALIAIAGVAGVWFTRSRGGIFGAAVGCGVFAAVALMLAKRRGSRWFAPALIAIPLIGLAVGALLFVGWQHAQEFRQQVPGIVRLLDNSCRLYFLGLALSCIGLHPFAGGGSRSFSWECYRFWDQKAQGMGGARPDMVHNEWVQSATDYGLVGAGLLAGVLGALALAAVLRVLFEETPKERDSRDAWRLGALAGLAGMLVQACFSFGFHMLAGVLLLGICLGMMSRSAERAPGPRTLGTRILLTIAALACAALLLPAGWTGSRVTAALWPVYFGHQPPLSTEARIGAFSAAIELWPQSAFYQERAALVQPSTGSNDTAGNREAAERALGDYQEASRLDPYNPAVAVNRANLLSFLQRDVEAEQWHAEALGLQGGMEAGFRAHYSLAIHLWHKGLRLCQLPTPRPALDAFECAATHIEEAFKQTSQWSIYADRVSIHESLGLVREATGDQAGALQAYNLASALPTGTRLHYRAGILLGKIAVKEWAQRHPSEALGHFMQARQRIGQAGSDLPQGVTPSQRLVYLAYLDRMIQFLTGAKIQPAQEKVERSR